jgi:hypothetical protein
MHDLDRTQMGFTADSFEPAAVGRREVFNEDEQMDLAASLMEISSEEEFENFLGDLISKGAQAVGKFISSPTGQALGGVLKNVAKQALPLAGTALGTFVGGPVGAQIGGALGSAATNLFEAENEEQEWEAANTFVKLAADAVKNAADAPAGANPQAVAKSAVIEAAKLHAPHLVPALSNGAMSGPQVMNDQRRTGRWVRHGDRIILLGI